MKIAHKTLLLTLFLLLLLCASACSLSTDGVDPSLPQELSANKEENASNDLADTDTAMLSLANKEEQPQNIAETNDETTSAVAIVEQAEQPSIETAAENEPEPSPVADTITPSALPQDPVILTISGDAVNKETAWTLAQLQSLTEGYREITYSTTNNWPSFSHMTAQGLSLPYLLRQAGLLDNAASFTFSATDGYRVNLTYEQIFGKQYAYSIHKPEGSSGALAIEPVIAWAWGDQDKIRPENIRPFFGHQGPLEVNTSAFIKDLCHIEASLTPADAWAMPQASIADGSTVPTGTELELLHDAMDSARIYYTTDGSEPDYNSPVYNPSTSYFQPQLTIPLILTKNVTIKAFAAALGKEKSPVATFSFVVE